MSALKFKVNPSDALEHLEETQFRIIDAVKLGMSQAMAGLAQHAAGNAPVFTGALVRAILNSPRVRTTGRYIIGTVSANVGAKHVGNYLEFGVKAATAKKGKFMKFTAADGRLVFTKNRAAIPPRPFMNRSLDEYKSTIIETVAARVREATT